MRCACAFAKPCRHALSVRGDFEDAVSFGCAKAIEAGRVSWHVGLRRSRHLLRIRALLSEQGASMVMPLLLTASVE